jgi:hypothetical protein
MTPFLSQTRYDDWIVHAALLPALLTLAGIGVTAATGPVARALRLRRSFPAADGAVRGRVAAAAERHPRGELSPHAARKNLGHSPQVGHPGGPCQYPPCLLVSGLSPIGAATCSCSSASPVVEAGFSPPAVEDRARLQLDCRKRGITLEELTSNAGS